MTFSMYRVALNTGAVIGPLVAAWLMTVSWDLLFWADGLTAIACALLARRFLPGPRAPRRRGATSAARRRAAPAGARAGGTARSCATGATSLYLFAMFASAVIYMQYFSVLPLQSATTATPRSSTARSSRSRPAPSSRASCSSPGACRRGARRPRPRAASRCSPSASARYGIEGGLVAAVRRDARRRPRPDRQRPDDVRPARACRAGRRPRQLRRRLAGDVRARRLDGPLLGVLAFGALGRRRVGRLRRRRPARRARRATHGVRGPVRACAPSPDASRHPPQEPHREIPSRSFSSATRSPGRRSWRARPTRSSSSRSPTSPASATSTPTSPAAPPSSSAGSTSSPAPPTASTSRTAAWDPVAILPGVEYAVPFAARLAERYGVPGAGLGAATILSDKALLRAVTSEAGIPNPRSERVPQPRRGARLHVRATGRSC